MCSSDLGKQSGIGFWKKFNLCCTFLSDMVEYECGDKISKVLVSTLGDFVAFFTYSDETNWLTVKRLIMKDNC